MDKQAFLAAISVGSVSFDVNDSAEQRTINGTWISEVLATHVPKCAIERAHIVGDIWTGSDVSASMQLTSCSLDNFDGSGSNFKSLVALNDCEVSGFISLTGSSLTRGIVLTGTRVAEDVSIALAEVRVQFNASSLSCSGLQMNGATIRGDCLLKKANLGDLHAQQSNISGTLNTEGIVLEGDLDIIGLHAFAWVSNGANISGAIFAESTDIVNVNLQGSRVSGNALFATSNIARGIDLTGAVFARGIYFTGATVTIIRLTSAKIAGPCQLGLVRADVIMAVDASFEGDIFLHDSTVANQVNLSGAHVSGAVYLDRLRVGGSVELRVSPLGATFRSGGNVTACGAEIGGQFVSTNAHIGGELLIASIACSDIILEYSVIRGSVNADAARVTGSLKADRLAIQAGALRVNRANFGGGISCNDAAVGGDVSLNSATVQTFTGFERTQIAASFSAIHARVDGPLYLQRARITGAIDLTQATISEIAFQSSFSDGWNDDVVRCGSVVFTGTTYDRLRVGWKPFSAYLAGTLDVNEDAIYGLERYLRRTARIGESEKVYLLRRRAETRRLRGINRFGATLIDWVTGFGVAKARLISVCIGILVALVAMCSLVPNFVVEDKGQCRGVVVVDFQEAVVVASKVFAPPEKDAKYRISDCPVVWNLRASTIVLFVQVAAAILLPVLLGTVTGLFRSQSRIGPD